MTRSLAARKKATRQHTKQHNARQLICLDLGNEQFTGALVNLRGRFEEQISLPVNGRTAQAALDLVYELLDQLLTHDDDTSNLVLIKMGQGIGSGIVLNGRIFYGEGFGAGEIGHVSVVANGEQCSCGNVGCLETVASVRAMLRQAETAASQNPNSLLATGNPITWEILRQACQQGDATAQQIVAQAGDFLGLAVANLVLLGASALILRQGLGVI